MLNNLNTNGFIVFRNSLSKEDISSGLKCFDTNSNVNYTQMFNFVNTKMLQIPNTKLGWDCQFLKLRVSDNNNSSDASTFHRDVVCINHKDTFPIFTCLTYFDETIMEVIPSSHLHIKNTLFSKKQKIKLKPGDILLFYSHLLHRGIFTEGLKQRRLVQVFDIFRNKHDYQLNKSKIIHVRGNETHSNLLITMSKYHIPAYLLNIFGYFNAINGYNYNYKPNKIKQKLNLPHVYSYISSEGLRGRLRILHNTFQENNKYILNDHTIDDLDLASYNTYKHIFYNHNFIKCSLFLLSLLIIVSIIVWLIIKKVFNS